MDRIVGSIVSQLRPYMYSTSAIGFVLSPEEIGGGAIRCSYATDAGSLSIDRGCKRDGSAYAGEGGLVHMLNEQIYGGAQWGSSNCLWGSATSEDRSTCMYNEVVIDLLDPTKTGLQIRSSDASSVVKIVGVTEKVVTSAAEVLATVTMGETHRSVGSTDMNEKSSRSHTIFRLVIESKLKDVHIGSGPEYRVSSLNLVDLAGSESASKSGVIGQRRTEGSYINKSLLTLATVIQRLITASGHVPYRDSKLTRILEPALGGNSRTAIICTVTPAAHHFA